ncbi:MAG TPA: 50S ribosomal protein L28 [Spirochaetia bacterium]|nr:50S ribosomal protein L28 [Spirochaetales bacterium]HRS66585.1 50S ribosomal protein L28 [Spirochaetia bacterium]HOT60474.1 50S ribosomal protein L28 [Spirochaetales bacterium]HPD80976.1 50S ribosomal protein L28 [Spirochaetales bacterium]HQG40099.1 50S ribosomal protein L28 [Spirochaetales bacterium]
MSRVCDICGKGPSFGNNVSHAKNRLRRTWRPNLISMRTMIDGTIYNVKVCSKCFKANKIVKYV